MTTLDNLGLLVAGLFRAPSGSIKTVNGFVDQTGSTFSLNVFGNSVNFVFNDLNYSAGISQVQVGKGNATPTRQDFDIETPFTNGGVEDSPVNVTTPDGYNPALGKITIGTQINPTAGAGTIEEVVFFKNMANNSGVTKLFCIFRDILGTPVSFIASQTINVDHEVLI